MKTTHWGKRRSGLSRGVWLSIAALAFALVFVLMRLVAPNLFLHALAPALSLGDSLSAGVGGVLASFADTRALAVKNASLESDNAALSLENRTLTEKAEDLTALLGSASLESREGILAGVLARPPVAAYDTLILSAGTSVGVREGMGVFGAGGLPLGMVSSVTADFSRATLFSAPGVRVAAWVGSARIPITLTGAGAGAYNASAPRSASIAIGDTVFLPGPGAIPIGTITRVGGETSDPLVTLLVHPAANPFSITWVSLRDIGEAFESMRLEATSTLAP
ncbi:MAG: rod shape-determining protein MreC [bacterium]|nr:rod shape-determining protein MreC [bacterium]